MGQGGREREGGREGGRKEGRKGGREEGRKATHLQQRLAGGRSGIRYEDSHLEVNALGVLITLVVPHHRQKSGREGGRELGRVR